MKLISASMKDKNHHLLNNFFLIILSFLISIVVTQRDLSTKKIVKIKLIKLYLLLKKKKKCSRLNNVV